MKRMAIACSLGLACSAGVLAAAEPSAGYISPPRAVLRDHACWPQQRKMTVTAVMRPISSGERLQMRFEVLQRTRSGRPVALAGRALNTWISPSDPTLGQQPGDVWIVHHPVTGLAAASSYRYKVQFRWIGAADRPLGVQTLLSRRCHQP